MAKPASNRGPSTTPRGSAATAAAVPALRKAAGLIASEGWNPDDQLRSIDGAISRAAESLEATDETNRLRLIAASHATIAHRLQRRWPGLSVDAWERDMYRSPEEIVALMASAVWPWQVASPMSPEASAMQAYAVLQTINTPTIETETIAYLIRKAFPSEWFASPGHDPEGIATAVKRES